MSRPSTLTWVLITSAFVLSSVLIHLFVYPNQLGALIVNSPAIKSLADEISIAITEYYTGETSERPVPEYLPPKPFVPKGEDMMTDVELAQFDGGPGSQGLYLSILGNIYDVAKGKQHYGPGGSYSGFAGRDGSRAFITGDFTDDGLNSDVLDLDPGQLMSLNEWNSFYRSDYRYVGKLIGRYYNQDGSETDYLRRVMRKINDGIAKKQSEGERMRQFPPCNSEWSQDAGGRVWCSTESGGFSREWAGYPRIFTDDGVRRCVCVRDVDFRDERFAVYENCAVDSLSCKFSDH